MTCLLSPVKVARHRDRLLTPLKAFFQCKFPCLALSLLLLSAHLYKGVEVSNESQRAMCLGNAEIVRISAWERGWEQHTHRTASDLSTLKKDKIVLCHCSQARIYCQPPNTYNVTRIFHYAIYVAVTVIPVTCISHQLLLHFCYLVNISRVI